MAVRRVTVIRPAPSKVMCSPGFKILLYVYFILYVKNIYHCKLRRMSVCLRVATKPHHTASCEQATGTCSCRNGTTGPKCATCRAGYWDLSTANAGGCRPCLAGAAPNTFMFSDANNVCRNCDAQCLQCSGPTAQDCLTCRTYRDNATCVATCPALHFPDAAGVCRPCDSQCVGSCTGMRYR